MPIPPLTIPSLDQFPNGTRLYRHGHDNDFYVIEFGRCYSRVFGSGLDHHFGKGSRGYAPVADGTVTLYVKSSDGQWLLACPSPGHFTKVEGQSRPDLDNGGSRELAAPRDGAPDVARPPASVGERGPILDASRASTLINFNVSLPNAKLGRVQDPDSTAFTGDFAKHQKAVVSFTKDVLNPIRKPQINIRGEPNNQPISRRKLAQKLAELLKVAYADARKRGEPLLSSDGAEVELERIILLSVERISKGGIKVALGFM